MRRLALLVVSLVVLVGVNAAVWRKEATFRQGRTVYLNLAPRDPRSLMAGDYMDLRWVVPRGIASMIRNDPERREGLVVLGLDERGVASVERFHRPGEELSGREQLLRYELREGRVVMGSDAFFFEEGTARYHQGAVFGELSVTRDGEAVLVALCDRRLERVGPPRKETEARR